MRLLAVALAVAGGLWIWLSRPGADDDAAQAASTRIGAPAPDFELSLVDGRRVSLSDLKGRAVVLNFWATWCPPCRAEMAALDQAQAGLEDRGVVVLGVNQRESESIVAGFVREQGLAFPIALDPAGIANEAYRVAALPTTYFIDRDGIIRDVVYGGPMTRALIESKAAALVD